MHTVSNVTNREWEHSSDVKSGWSIVEDHSKQKVLLVFTAKDSISLVVFK